MGDHSIFPILCSDSIAHEKVGHIECDVLSNFSYRRVLKNGGNHTHEFYFLLYGEVVFALRHEWNTYGFFHIRSKRNTTHLGSESFNIECYLSRLRASFEKHFSLSEGRFYEDRNIRSFKFPRFHLFFDLN